MSTQEWYLGQSALYTDHTPKLSRLSVGLTLVGAAVCLTVGAMGSVLSQSAVVWGSWALGAWCAGLIYVTASARGSVGLGLAEWRLGSWMLFWYGLTFGLATVTWSHPQPSPANQIALSSVLRALWLVAAGVTSWTVGYLAGPSRSLRRLAARGMAALGRRCSGTVRGKSTPWIIYCVGMASQIAGTVTTGRFGYAGDPSSALVGATGYEQLLGELALLCPLGLCAAALQVYRERLPGARVTLAVLFAAEIASGAAAGGKESFVIAVLAVIIPMSAARRRMPKVLVVAGVLIFLVIVMPFNQAYRTAVRGGPAVLSASQAIDHSPMILRQELKVQSLIAVLPESADSLLQRVQEIDGPAIILQRTPRQVPFSSPAELISAPLADMVPRAIWPGKPILAPGYEFSQQYYGIPSAIYTSSAISPIGDLYRHGGWIPVLAGMFAFGWGVRLLDDVLDVRANPHAIFLVLLLFPNLVKGELDWVTFLAGIPATVAVWLLATRMTFRTGARA